ncbi:MAG: metalloregulator ArsR/SmtB family transcription factor [Chthoniobacterales bacterium]
MSKRRSSGLATAAALRRHAPVFAALGDATRLTLLARLCERSPCSISHLAKTSPLTRQAITKHLRVLEGAGLVRGEISGRECRFEIEPEPLQQAREYLDLVAEQWDAALVRLKNFVENDR